MPRDKLKRNKIKSNITVYKIHCEVDQYKYILSDETPPVFDGKRFGNKWHSPSAYCPYPKKPEADTWGCFLIPNAFAVNETARSALRGFIDESAEELVVDFPDTKLTIINVIEVINCLDDKHSESWPGVPHMIDKYSFFPNRFTYSLFKVPQQSMSHPLCVEGMGDPELEFKHVFESSGLSGLRFELIWSEKS